MVHYIELKENDWRATKVIRNDQLGVSKSRTLQQNKKLFPFHKGENKKIILYTTSCVCNHNT